MGVEVDQHDSTLGESVFKHCFMSESSIDEIFREETLGCVDGYASRLLAHILSTS